jgi:hypothetical protein
VRGCESHSSNHDIKGGDGCGRGSVNEGPTCCTRKLYCCVAHTGQYGAPPMDGSKEDGQAGCTEKSYWGATKKVGDIDQYMAPPMDGLKDYQVGAPMTAAVTQGPAAPATVAAGAPTAVAMSKGLTVFVAGPAGALTPAVRKRRLVEGWPMIAPAAAPAGVPTMTASAKEPMTPTVGLVGALVLATMKGGPAEGWGCVMEGAAVTTPTARSREVVMAA